MDHPSLRNLSFSSAHGPRVAGQGFSRPGIAAMAALVLAACAFVSIGPAAAADGAHATYCLSSDSENDCGFTSLAQCEATASGGLGECKMATAGSRNAIRLRSTASRPDPAR